MVFLVRKVSDSSRLLGLFSNVLKRQSSSRVNVRKPREPHTERQKYLILTRTILPPHPEEFMPQSLKCRLKLERTKVTEKKDNPFQRLFGEKILKYWNDAKMILIFQHNSMKKEEHYSYKVLFYRQQMDYHWYFQSLVKEALTDTKFENVLKVIDRNTVFVTSPEVKLQEALKITKKTPNLILLTAIVDDRMLSRAEILKYSEIGDITNARAGLVASLNSAGQSLVSNSTRLQQNLVSLLDQHISLQEDSSPASGTAIPETLGAVAAEVESKIAGEQISSDSGSTVSEASGVSAAGLESKAGEQESDDSSSSSSDSESDSDEDKKK